MTTAIDLKAALAASVSFFRGHELGALARELPSSIELSAEQRSRVDQAGSEGFDASFAFPSVATQKFHFDAMVKQLATAPVFGLPKSEQYTPLAAPDIWNLKMAPARNRPAGPYLLMYHAAPFPDETRGKDVPELDRLFARKGWNGLTLSEYLVLQRLFCEENRDHHFDVYAPDAARSQWQWLLDTRLPNGVVIAFWNPKICRLEIGVATQGPGNTRRGAHPTVIVPLV